MTEETRALVEACHTDDEIDHGRHHVEECFWAIIEKYGHSIWAEITESHVKKARGI